MQKIFTTQLIGRFQRIEEKEGEMIEDGGRLLAQALVGEGNIYVYTGKEMAGIFIEAIHGQEPLRRAEKLDENIARSLTPADRAILIARNCDKDLMSMAKILHEKQVPFVAVTSQPTEELDTLAHVSIDLHTDKGLIPADTGERTGFPHQIAALFIYHHIKLTMDEMLADYV